MLKKCVCIQKLEQANKKAVTSAQKSGKAAKSAAQDAAAAAVTAMQAEHAKQLSAWHAANDDAAASDAKPVAVVAAVESNAARAPVGLSKAAKRRLAKEKAEEEHNARVAEAAANGCVVPRLGWKASLTRSDVLRVVSIWPRSRQIS